MNIDATKGWTLLLPRWLEVGLILLAAWLLSGLFIAGSNMPLSSHLGQTTLSESVPESVNLNDLRSIDVFGQVVEQKNAPKPQQPKDTAVVDSRLNIKLIGTVVAGDKSAAMVSLDGSRKQAVFFLKEEIQANVTLEEVEATEIVVINRGKRERISIAAAKSIQQAVAKPTPRRPIAPRSSAPRQTINKKINRNKLNSQMRNFSTLLSQARVSPHFSNGKPDGFTISEIVKGSLYEEIGLLNGDIIKSVNGESVTGAEQAMRMYRELQSATFIDVEVERNGGLQQLSYVIQ